MELRWTWLATGNHLEYSDEIQRRVVPVNLDPEVEHPHLRSGFRHKLPDWAVANRHRLIGAVVLLVRAWLEKDRPGPAEGVPPLGSFEAWRDVLGGVLNVAGIEGFLSNVAGTETTMSERELRAVFLNIAMNHFGSQPFTVADVDDLDVAETIVPDAERMTRAFSTRLGLWLKKSVRVPAGGRRLVADGLDPSSGAARYRVEMVDERDR